ncbi:hypothetical protein [Pseudomonas floridensis]|uniref:hypothetical protein n=1 Tax=Pseudomonas floridensis TaxID=1958950 RepID=UPI0012FFB933|nr:hypothetical protein [Pseudomonas floridensis]
MTYIIEHLGNEYAFEAGFALMRILRPHPDLAAVAQQPGLRLTFNALTGVSS